MQAEMPDGPSTEPVAGPPEDVRLAGLQSSPSKQQQLWLQNPNSHTSLHLDPAQEKEVMHSLTFSV